MTPADLLVVALRAVSLIAALQAAGLVYFGCVFEADGERRTARSSVAVAALVLTVVAQLATPARFVGSVGGIWDGSLQWLALASEAGTTTTIRVAGLMLIAAGTAHARGGQASALTGAALVAASFGFMGHTTTADHRWLAAVMLVFHVLIVAFWLGALLPLRRACLAEPSADAARLIARFSRAAIRLVPVIFVAGAIMTTLLLPSWQSLGSPYGRLLVLKTVGFGLLMGLAAWNKWRLGPAVAHGQRQARRAFARQALIEWWLIVGVLAATTVMTSFFSPAQA